jgi:acetyl esterase/lipase
MMDAADYDNELVAAIAAGGIPLPPPLEPDGIADRRRFSDALPGIEQTLSGRAVAHQETVIPDRGLPVAVFAPTDPSSRARAAVYFIHGGGMIAGDRHGGIEQLLDWVQRYGIVAVSIEYRLAPEHRDPIPAEDCYAGLTWTVEHAHQLGIDADRLVVMGASAGAGLAAGISLMSRDRSGPAIAGQLLDFPMLDDRNDRPSTHRFADAPVWPRSSNDTAWDALLGDRRRSGPISSYAAPSRATDLHGLPATFIDVGSSEIFVDEDVAYADALRDAGCSVELHVWAGGFHNFERYAPNSLLAQSARAARESWLVRTLGLNG